MGSKTSSYIKSKEHAGNTMLEICAMEINESKFHRILKKISKK